jgi:Zn-dependent metalloprotease
MARLFNCGITPPHILEEILRRGSSGQQDRALRTLTISGQLRGRRQSLLHIKFPVPRNVKPLKERYIYDAGFGDRLPGKLVRKEGSTLNIDVAANEAYDGAGLTWDLFNNLYGRNSIDNKGMHLISTVHYLQGYDNAFWNGEQMVYGDGDEDLPEEERLFNRFTIAPDIIGHELTHGVTQFEAGLSYWEQSGALNESFSDVFGVLVKQKLLGQSVDQSNWLLGEGLFTDKIKGRALRSLIAPGTAYDDPVIGKDPQPGHMKDYVHTVSDNGGVHINSGIPNRAFYLTAFGIGGFAWEKAGRIWYMALRDKLHGKSDFQDAADMTWLTAGEEFGSNSREQMAVYKGWEAVGIVVNRKAQGKKIEKSGKSQI